MTLFDHAVLAISGFSVLFGLMRGFTREVISLASWAVAFIAASAYGGSAAGQFTAQVADDNWRALVGFVVVFLVTLIAMNIVAMLASRRRARPRFTTSYLLSAASAALGSRS